MDAGGLAGAVIGNDGHAIKPFGEEFVGRLFDPVRHLDIRRAAIGGIVFEAAFVGRIVRWADDDAVGQVGFPAAIVAQDRVRDHGRGCVAMMFVDHRLHPVRGEHLDGSGESGFRQGMGVHPQKQRPINPGMAAVKADRLRDGADMRLVEGGGKGGSAMP
jgi:hypothetical protein